MKQYQVFPAFLLTLCALYVSCTNYEQALKKDFDFPPPDSTKFNYPDVPSGKLFDLLGSQSTGIDFLNEVKFGFMQDNNLYVNYYNGGGVAIINYNNDSLPDLYFTGNIVPDRLYENLGNMRFRDVSQQAGILQNNKGWSTGVAFCDINRDGFEDIYVLRSRYKDTLTNLFYVSNGNGTYTERASEYGIACGDCYSMGAVFFDADNDGDLDLYVKNHPTDYVERMRFNNLEKIEKGVNQSDKFFRNDRGKFVDVSKQAGINNHGFGLAVCAADFNSDGWMDIYCCNDFAMYDYVYINQKDGTFKEMSDKLLDKMSMFSMGVDIGDINNDGLLDIVTADMRFDHSYLRRSFALGLRRNEFFNMVTSGYRYQYVKNTLHLNNDNNSFSEIANLAQVDATDWSWGPMICDFDHDGLKDLFIPNGYYRWLNVDERELYQAMRDATRRKDSAAYDQLFKAISKKKLLAVNYIFKNQNGYQFTREMENWGVNYPTITHGAAIGDLDADGDMDIVTNNHELSPLLYRNNQDKLIKANWVQFSLQGSPNNPEGIGTKVYLWSPRGFQMAHHHTTKGYQSASQNIVHFGLANDNRIDRLVVVWPDGRSQQLYDLEVNKVHKISYKNSVNEPFTYPEKPKSTLFADVAQRLNIQHKHKENEYEDFRKEILLPHKLSRYGPGLAVADVNGDGREDFLVSGAARSANTLYLQTASGTFEQAPSQPWESHKQSETLGVLFFDADNDGDLDLYTVSGGNEFKKDDPLLEDKLYVNDGKGNFSYQPDALPKQLFSGSCVVAGDYDADGDLDLFVGGRVVPAYYPLPAACAILRNDGGKFTDVTSQVAPELAEGGLICAALWSDYNNDNKIDLLVAGEWTAVRIFENQGGKLIEKSQTAGTAAYTGWWNSLTGGDFDNDGDIDYVVGNEGLNSRYYQPTSEEPVELFCADFDNNGTNDLLLSVYNFGKPYPIKTRLTMTEQVPSLGKKFPLYKQFALATTPDVFGKEALKKSLHLKATSFHSALLRNNGNGTFTHIPLPLQAQFSCLYGMVPTDINQDGHLDLIAHGNFFSTETEVEKQDACVGLTLLGEGNGQFSSVPVWQSGFFNKKDGKALSLIFVGQEKRMVLLGTNNNDAMIAFEAQSRPSVLPITFNDSYALIYFTNGTTRKHEFYIGSGYLSQSSPQLAFYPSLVEKIVVTDRSGTQRIAFQNTKLLAKY